MLEQEKTLFEASQYETVPAKEMAEKLQEQVDAYKARIDEVMDGETLDAEEKEIMALMDENDKYIKGVTYELPADTTFEGKKYTRSQVSGKIIYFLSRNEQTWQYVTGLHQLVQLWRGSQPTISHGAMDSTLRLLDQQKYKGDSEWVDIMIVNEYLRPLHEAYAKNIVLFTALSKFHNIIIERRDMISKVGTVNETAE